MNLENSAIIKTDNLPIRHEGNVHKGKVRSVYWLNRKDSERVGNRYSLDNYCQLGIMITSDNITAFDVRWHGEALKGVPRKGASLNASSHHWFERFEQNHLAGNHIIDDPHPLVWIVEKAEPIMIEAIARQYMTGSMWRKYEAGERTFCGIGLPKGMKEGDKLDSLLITPTTKGIIRGIPDIPEKNDAKITRQQIIDNFRAFGFKSVEDVAQYETLLKKGFQLISSELDNIDLIFVDTKFEVGYVRDSGGNLAMIYMDEIGTPDSSRIWDKSKYLQGEMFEKSKEPFRQQLLHSVPDSDVLLNDDRMAERIELAKNYRVPDSFMIETSELYAKIAEQITGKPLPKIENPREEIIDSLEPLGIIEKVKQ